MSARAILTSLAGALRGGGVSPAPHLDIRTGVEHLVVVPPGDDCAAVCPGSKPWSTPAFAALGGAARYKRAWDHRA